VSKIIALTQGKNAIVDEQTFRFNNRKTTDSVRSLAGSYPVSKLGVLWD